MAISFIPNQQFIFDFAYDSCNQSDPLRYCQMIKEDDQSFFQFKQSPCGDNLVCSNNFDVTNLLSDVVTNGGFVGASTSWTLSHWVWAAGNKIRANTNGIGYFEQNIGALVAGEMYALTFTILDSAGLVDGTIQARVGGNYFGGKIYGNGTYTLYGVCGSGDTLLHFDSDTSITGDGFAVTNISLKQTFGGCWKANNGNLIVGDGSICHIAGIGNTTNLVQEGMLVYNCYYKIEVTISNRTQGNIVIEAGGTDATPIDANGVQTVYLSSQGNDFLIILSDLFDGCINEVNVYLLTTDFQVILKDINNNFVSDLNPLVNLSNVEVSNEYVTFFQSMVLGNVIKVGGDSSGVVEYGCYKYCIYDPCKITRTGTAGLINSFSGWAAGAGVNFTNTIVNGGWYMRRSGAGAASGILTMNAGGYPIYNWTHASMQMIISIQITTGIIQDTTNSLYINLPNNQKLLIKSNIASNSYYTYHTTVTVVNTIGATYQDQIRLVFEAAASAGDNSNYIRFVSVTALPMTNRDALFDSDSIEFCSNCMSWKHDHPCTKLFVGNPNSLVSNGFNFNNFSLQNRLRILSFNPNYFQDEEDYLFSDGNRQITYSQSEKYKILLFDYVDEITHDNINALINSYSLLMDGTEIYIRKGEYQPEWDKDGREKMAQSKVQAKIKNNTIFNTLCS